MRIHMTEAHFRKGPRGDHHQAQLILHLTMVPLLQQSYLETQHKVQRNVLNGAYEDTAAG